MLRGVLGTRLRSREHETESGAGHAGIPGSVSEPSGLARCWRCSSPRNGRLGRNAAGTRSLRRFRVRWKRETRRLKVTEVPEVTGRWPRAHDRRDATGCGSGLITRLRARASYLAAGPKRDRDRPAIKVAVAVAAALFTHPTRPSPPSRRPLVLIHLPTALHSLRLRRSCRVTTLDPAPVRSAALIRHG